MGVSSPRESELKEALRNKDREIRELQEESEERGGLLQKLKVC